MVTQMGRLGPKFHGQKKFFEKIFPGYFLYVLYMLGQPCGNLLALTSTEIEKLYIPDYTFSICNYMFLQRFFLKAGLHAKEFSR